jgi:hypothetical protein
MLEDFRTIVRLNGVCGSLPKVRVAISSLNPFSQALKPAGALARRDGILSHVLRIRT